MSSPERRTLAVKIGELMDAVGGDDIIPIAIARDVRQLYPVECEAVGNEAIERFIVDIVVRRLKPSSEQTPRLPDFDLPARLPIPVEGGHVWRLTRQCTEADYDAYESMLRQGIDDDRTALRKFQQEKRRIVKLLHAAGVATLAELP